MMISDGSVENDRVFPGLDNADLFEVHASCLCVFCSYGRRLDFFQKCVGVREAVVSGQ